MARSYLIYGTKSKQFFPHLQPTQQKTQKIWNLRILRSYRIFWQRKYLLFRTMFCTSIAVNYGLMQFCCDVSKMRGFVVIELKNFAECVMIMYVLFCFLLLCIKISVTIYWGLSSNVLPTPAPEVKDPGPCCNISLSAESEDWLCSVTASIPLSLTDWVHFTRAWGPVTHCSAADQMAIEWFHYDIESYNIRGRCLLAL